MQLVAHAIASNARGAGVPTDCDSYLPGHLLHWMQWKKAQAARCVPVTRVHLDGTSIELVLPGRPPLRWLHHDPAGLRAALASAQLPILACPEWMALRVDGFWFNCAPDIAGLELCR